MTPCLHPTRIWPVDMVSNSGNRIQQDAGSFAVDDHYVFGDGHARYDTTTGDCTLLLHVSDWHVFRLQAMGI